MKKILSILAVSSLLTSALFAGTADTLPKRGIMIETNYGLNDAFHTFDANGKLGPIAQEIPMYEPTGSLQGKITADKATNRVIVNLTTIAYGVTDNLTMALAIPYVLSFKTDLNLGWTPGVFSKTIGRAYTEDDFWKYAGSMGQNKPSVFEAKNRLADIILAAKYRFYKNNKSQLGVFGYINAQTGKPGDAEDLGSKGTTVWDLGEPIGDLGIKLDADTNLHDLVNVGAEIYYEHFLPQEMNAPTGIRNPLLLMTAAYTGATYTVKPGPMMGGYVEANLAPPPIAGIGEGTSWITKGNPEMQKTLPKLFTVGLSFKLWYAMRSRFESLNSQWNYEQEKLALGSVRSTYKIHPEVNFLRVGVPLAFYYEYWNMELFGTNLIPIIGNTFGMKLIAALPGPKAEAVPATPPSPCAPNLRICENKGSGAQAEPLPAQALPQAAPAVPAVTVQPVPAAPVAPPAVIAEPVPVPQTPVPVATPAPECNGKAC